MSFERTPYFAAEIPGFPLDQGIDAQRIDMSRDQAAPAAKRAPIRRIF